MASGAGSKPSAPSIGTVVLACIPLVVAVLLGALLLPRSVPPEDVPLPVIDARALARQVQGDHALADEARRAELPPEVRAVGTAIRGFNEKRAHEDQGEIALHQQKADLDDAVSLAFKRHGPHPLLALRAFHMESFLAEVSAYEETGKVTPEMVALGGGFVPRMESAGWVRARRVLLDDAQRRAAFKMMWNGTISGEGIRELALSLDETRALYTLYLLHPHPSESAVTALDAARRTAQDATACAALQAGERVETERWRIDKIRKLAALDASYPLAFALGVANYRRGSFPAAAENFRDWLRDHPDGRFALRARNHLKASIDADQAAP